MEKNFSPWPFYSEEEIDAVTRVLRSGKVNYWTGEYCKHFESEFAQTMGAEFGIAVANGTLALELALRAIDLQPGDEVIVPARTFIATASAVVRENAKPIVVDIDPITQNLTAETIASHITTKTRAIIVVHLAGMPCEMDAIMALAEQHHLKVIEDCAQAHGARYCDRTVGSIGHLAAFSFCQDKIMSTGGEGGMVLTSDESLYQKMYSFKDHGKNFKKLGEPEAGGYKWLHDSFGSNYRMTEAQAVIGLAQLKKLPEWLKRRREIAEYYTKVLSELSEQCILPAELDNRQHAFYKYLFQIHGFNLEQRTSALKKLRTKGIPIFSGFSPDISKEKAFEGFDFIAHPEAETTAERSLMLLCHPTLKEEEIVLIAGETRQALMELL